MLSPEGFSDEGWADRLISRMRDRLIHRGPDANGNWVDAGAGVALGFCRLSIVELSAAGHQPMLSADERCVLVFNGEIYNAEEMRAEIDAARGGHPWRGHADTEVLVEAIASWGVEGAVRRANGMFALAAWDRHTRTLSLARDRMGKKPLHYAWAGTDFIFASEVRALREHPKFTSEIDVRSLSDFLRIGYVGGTRTMFASVRRLPGGHVLSLDARAMSRREIPATRPYWSLRDAALAGLEAGARGEPPDAEALRSLLGDAVARRMVADVPVGAFLSGGVDSSLVVALMARQSKSPVRSFSIGFHEPAWDEAPHARAVAAHLGTLHSELYVGTADIVRLAEDMAGVADEPLADDSIIPTTLLCRLARQGVTVALSGDGGDELFAGYRRYAAVATWLRRREALPAPLGKLGAHAARDLATAFRAAGRTRASRRLRLLSEVLGGGDALALHARIVSQTLDPDALLARPLGAPHPLTEPAYDLGVADPVDQMCFADAVGYLTDDILAKVDRASMSASLEVRCPLLDYRVVEAAWRFPSAAKIVNGTGKMPLRAVLNDLVPPRLTDRPKRGFGAPVAVWLRRELRDWAEAHMSSEALARTGLLDVEACRSLWTRFLQGRHGFDPVLWNVVVFQAWAASLHLPIGRGEADARAAAPRFAPS